VSLSARLDNGVRRRSRQTSADRPERRETVRGDIEVVSNPAGGVDQPTGVIEAFGDIWFTSIANGRIGRFTGATHRSETFADPAGGSALPANPTVVRHGADAIDSDRSRRRFRFASYIASPVITSRGYRLNRALSATRASRRASGPPRQ
jgi:hypothetical protein